MHIITWNVNGIRAIMAKGYFDWLLEQDADLVCLQEIKARHDQLNIQDLNRLSGWNVTWHSAMKAGYSGVASFSREIPNRTAIGINGAWNDTEGRVICTELCGYSIYNVYFPNGQRDQGRLDFKLDFYANFLAMCERELRLGKHLIVCGDFNTAHKPIDLKNWRQNEKTSGFLPEERDWIDRYLQGGFVDAFRFLYPDKIQYTWWTYIGNARARNVGWRLDYFLISTAAARLVRDVVIHDEIKGSDHCPVSLYID